MINLSVNKFQESLQNGYSLVNFHTTYVHITSINGREILSGFRSYVLRNFGEMFGFQKCAIISIFIDK